MKLASALVLALSISTASAFECTQNEAQFIGEVKEVRVIQIDQGIRDCAYTLKFKLFNPSIICPIDSVTAEQTEIIDFDCRLNAQAGDVLSGILLQGMNGNLVIEQ